MPDSVAVDAPAKVNLRLHVLAREESGYHSLETIFCAISLADELRVERGAAGIRLSVDGDVDTGPPDRNLAVRSAERFYRELGESPAVDLRLTKRIPSAAGLGGGSSDAAATLRALNALHGGPFTRPMLLRMAIELGADVPFFLCGSPFAIAWGRGERLMPLPPLPSRPVLVAHPGESMSTADAFARIAESRGGSYRPAAALIEPEALVTWDGIAALAENDFEPPAIERIPILGTALREMRSAGARVALLAGSGSSVFGIFDDESVRDRASAAVEALGMRCWRAATLAEEPAPRLELSGSDS